MSEKKKRKFEVLSEEVRKLGDASGEENPYWGDPPPHPNPELGCIRRGICCKSSPGWFGPGEIDKAAALLEMTPDDFVRKYAVVDSATLDGEEVHAFAPVKLDQFGEPMATPGSRVDGTYRYFRGQCIFYTGEGCGIYGARPVECRAYVCTNLPEENLSHREIARMWKEGRVWEKPEPHRPPAGPGKE